MPSAANSSLPSAGTLTREVAAPEPLRGVQQALDLARTACGDTITAKISASARNPIVSPITSTIAFWSASGTGVSRRTTICVPSGSSARKNVVR